MGIPTLGNSASCLQSRPDHADNSQTLEFKGNTFSICHLVILELATVTYLVVQVPIAILYSWTDVEVRSCTFIFAEPPAAVVRDACARE
jgi:hypothetical protein